MNKIIKTVGELKQALSGIEDDVKIGVEDADTCWPLHIIAIELDTSKGLLLLETDYNHRIGDEDLANGSNPSKS